MDYELIAAIIFYVVVILLIYIFRKKFEIQGKIIALYRMKLGITLMDRIAKRFPRSVHVFAMTGIIVGFIGMIAIIALLIFGVYTSLFVPDAPPTVAPVLPGLPIPGSPIRIPLVSGLLAIFIVAAVHEFCHGVVARRYNYVVKNTGIVFFGPIVGAFVEPDEKTLIRAPAKHQLAIYAAGSFSNIVIGALGIALLLLVFFPLGASFVENKGITVLSVVDNFPAEKAGLQVEDVITHVNGKPIQSREEFSAMLEKISPGEAITISTKRGDFPLTTTTKPTGDGAYIGITLTNAIEIKESLSSYKWLLSGFFWILSFIQLLVIISLGIGLFNLAPLGPIDGGRMLLTALGIFMEKERAQTIWKNVSIALLLILALNFIPFFKAVIFAIF